MAAALEECKACSVCQVARPAEAFSKKQFKAKAHERTCLVCAGLSKETGAPGIRIGDTVLWVLPSPSGAARGYWNEAPWQDLALYVLESA